MSLIVLDILTNYCGDFYSNLIGINLQVISVALVTQYVTQTAVVFAILNGLMQLAVCNMVFMGVAVFFGQNTLVFGQFMHLNRFFQRFMFNICEGLIFVHRDTSKVAFINKSALRMLTDEKCI